MLLYNLGYIDIVLVNLQIYGLAINSVKWPISQLIPTQHPTDMVPITNMLNIGSRMERCYVYVNMSNPMAIWTSKEKIQPCFTEFGRRCEAQASK